MAVGLPEKVVRIQIFGRVQGVWYRGWTVEQAAARNLSGWVRNRSDGSVEGILAGAAAQVDDMVAACWHGPAAAQVSDIVVEPAAAPEGTGFHQKPTV